MKRAELKQQAKDSLRGRWGTAIAMILVYFLINMGISIAGAFTGIGSIAVVIISIPISFGLIGQIMKFSRNENVGMTDFLNIGFKNFGKAWSIFGNILLKLIPYVLLIIIIIIALVGMVYSEVSNNPDAFLDIVDAETDEEVIAIFLDNCSDTTKVGVITTYIALYIVSIIFTIKQYLYELAEYIGNDSDTLKGKELVNRSAELMKGNRWKLFVLELSFIGWAILAVLTCGIGFLWLIPYMQVTTVKFYEDVAGINKNNDNEVIIENN